MTTDGEAQPGLLTTGRPLVRLRSERAMAWRRLRRNRAAMLGATVLMLFIVVAIFADAIAKQPVQAFPDFEHCFLPPGSAGFILGTDDIGRDVLSRIIHGTRISLRVGILAVLIASLSGTILGVTAGYFGRWIDMVISRLLDLLLAFPGLLLAVMIVASLGPGLQNAMFALGVAGIPSYARVVRGSTLAAKEFPYVLAAQSVGLSDTRIMVRHILPNVVSPILIMATLGLGSTIISAAGLSFLGLGAAPPTPEWGLELSISRAYLSQAPWVSTLNGVAISVTVLAINMFGDGLREALDPQASSWVK